MPEPNLAVTDRWTALKRRFTAAIEQLAPTEARVIAALLAGLGSVLVVAAGLRLVSLLVTVGTWPTLAQSTATASNAAGGNTQQVQDAVCGTGLGPLLGIVLVLIALYLLVKAVIRGMIAFDRMGSARSDDVRQGKEQLKGSVMTVLGAMVPGIFLAIMEVIGYPTISCISDNIQIFAIVPI